MVPDIVGRKKMLFIRFGKKNQTPIKFLFFNSIPFFTNDSIKVLKIKPFSRFDFHRPLSSPLNKNHQS